MEEWASTLATKLVLSMVLVTVTHNARTTSSSSTERPTVKTGRMVLVITALVVLKWTSGESNSISTAYTPHACTVKGQTRCEGADCGDGAGQRHTGVCDKDGCDFNPYRLGNKTFFGPKPNFTIDTTKPFTVVTQFVTSDGTDNSDLSEIRRMWVQNGKTMQNSRVSVGGKQYNSVTDDFCNVQKQVFGDPNDYEKRGGHKAMGGSLERGMVLVMSLW